ncbi:hypothetical protein [uncultured Mediterranean phage uvMED]|nr:hypothetical protein [uncultured Mediterranean phage uvMED]
MLYYKRKDGSVFGKLDSISDKVKKEFKDKGYVECDENGAVKSAPVKKVAPKKKVKK